MLTSSLRADQLLLARGVVDLGAEQIAFHAHAGLDICARAVQRGLRALLRILRNFDLAFGQQLTHIGIHHAQEQLLIGAVELASGQSVACLACINRLQLAPESKSCHCAEKRVT